MPLPGALHLAARFPAGPTYWLACSCPCAPAPHGMRTCTRSPLPSIEQMVQPAFVVMVPFLS